MREWKEPRHVRSRRAPGLLFGPPVTLLLRFFSLHPLQLLPRSVTNDFRGQFISCLDFSSDLANSEHDPHELSFGPDLLEDVSTCVS